MATYTAHPAAEAFPLLDEARLTQLTADIAANGQLAPVTLWKDADGATWLLDGRNRVRACLAAGVQVASVWWDGDHTWAYVWSCNGERRDLDEGQRAAIKLDIDKGEQAYLQERRGGDRKSAQAKEKQSGTVATLKTREKLAKAAQVSPRTAQKAITVKKKAPALHKQVVAGEVQLSQAYREVVKADKQAKQAEAAKQAPPAALDDRWLPCRIEDAELQPEGYDLVLTDPPYGVADANITRSNQGDLVREYGQWDEGEFPIENWAARIVPSMKPGASLYLFIGDALAGRWRAALEAEGLTWIQLLIWHKTNPAPQIRKTRWCNAQEFILFMAKGRPTHFNFVGQNEMHSVITGPIAGGSERQGHTTEKPLWLLGRLLAVSCPPGGRVLDPFAGSGSTGEAAIKCGASATLVEPEKAHVQMIRARMAKYAV